MLQLIHTNTVTTAKALRTANEPITTSTNPAVFQYLPTHAVVRVLKGLNVGLKAECNIHPFISVESVMYLLEDKKPFENKIATLWMGRPGHFENDAMGRWLSEDRLFQPYFVKLDSPSAFKFAVDYFAHNLDYGQPPTVCDTSFLLFKKKEELVPLIDVSEILEYNALGALYIKK